MANAHPQAAGWLENFRKIALDAAWRDVNEMRRTYPHADMVRVKSGRIVIVLNVAGNKYRLVTAVHFRTQIIFTLRFLTHAEYSKEAWKDEL